MSIVDKLFACQETPVWTPATLDPTSLPPCLSCTFRLSAQLPGPGSLQPSVMGFTVDENPTTELTLNGLQHSLLTTELVMPGLHRLYGQQTVSDAELILTFRNIRDMSKIALLCIPIVIGDGHGSDYFSTIGIVGRSRPTVSVLIDPETAILSYTGASLQGRSKSDPRPRQACNPVAYPVTYYVVLTPANISAPDYQRLHKQLGSAYVGPPTPVTEITMTRATSLLTYINSIMITAEQSKKEKGKSTKALKCYRIDPKKDVKGDKVYIGGAPKSSTLDQELLNAASGGGADPDSGSVKPGDIEKILSIILGIVLAIVVCAAIGFFVFRKTFSKYITALKLYAPPPPPVKPTP
jgi:hypothetical protein